MTLKKITLFLFLTVSLSIFCVATSSAQTAPDSSEYPKQVAYEGDTLVLVTMAQVDSLNLAYVRLNKYKELYDSLSSTVEKYEVVISKDEKIIEKKDQQLAVKDSIIEQDSVIMKERERQVKDLTKEKDKLKKQRNVLAGISAALAILFGVTIAVN